MFPEQELRERLARIAATFPEDTDAAFERLVRRRRRDPRPIAIAIATAVAAAMIAAGIAIARTSDARRFRPPAGRPCRRSSGLPSSWRGCRRASPSRGATSSPWTTPPWWAGRSSRSTTTPATWRPARRRGWPTSSVTPPRGRLRWRSTEPGARSTPLEAARYPHGRVRTVRGHQAVELPQLRPPGNDIRGAAGREMAERIWMERPGLLVRVLSYELTDTLVERLVATMQFPPDRDGQMQPPRLEPLSNFRLDPGEPVVRDRVPVLAREYWVEVDGPVRDQFKGSDERLLVRSAREASAASVERLARRHACARETTVRGHHAWLYARALKDAAPVRSCERAAGLALAWIEHDDVAIEVAGQGRAPLSEELLRRVADGLRPLDLRSLVEGP